MATEPTERELRAATEWNRSVPEPPEVILDRLASDGHARNGFCEVCWRAAGWLASSDPTKTQVGHYFAVLEAAEDIAATKETN